MFLISRPKIQQSAVFLLQAISILGTITILRYSNHRYQFNSCIGVHFEKFIDLEWSIYMNCLDLSLASPKIRKV